MKKYIFIVTSFLIVTLSNAQEIKGGVRGGLNYSFFTEDTKKDNGSLGFEIGYFERLEFDNNYVLQAEVNYTANSYKNSDTKTVSTYNYLEIPFLVKRKITPEFEVGAGIKYAFGLDGKVKYDNDDIEDEDIDVNGGFGYLVEGAYVKDKLMFGLRLSFKGGEVLNGYYRRSANVFVAYTIF